MDATVEHSWEPGPGDPVLGERGLHVWRARLECCEEELEELLSAEEQRRAERIARPEARRLWRRSRGVLRALLGRYLDRDAATLQFVRDDRGKPSLLEAGRDRLAPQQPPISFSLSHSGSGAVGVDVEARRHQADVIGLARRTFGAAEAARLAALQPPARMEEFLRGWVRHEAEVKCLGTGLAGPRNGTARLWVRHLALAAEGTAAVAAEAEPHSLRCLDWC